MGHKPMTATATPLLARLPPLSLLRPPLSQLETRREMKQLKHLCCKFLRCCSQGLCLHNIDISLYDFGAPPSLSSLLAALLLLFGSTFEELPALLNFCRDCLEGERPVAAEIIATEMAHAFCLALASRRPAPYRTVELCPNHRFPYKLQTMKLYVMLGEGSAGSILLLPIRLA